jgi:hypothetical protein
MKHHWMLLGTFVISAISFAQDLDIKVQTEINQFLDLMKSEYLFTKEVDWDGLRTQALEVARTAPKGGALRTAINGTLEKINHPAMVFETRWTAAEQKQRGTIGELGLRADPETGMVYELFAGGAAEKEGIRLGDQLVAINGQPPKIRLDTVHSVGVVVPVTIKRGDQSLELSVPVLSLKSIVAPMHAGHLGRGAYLEPARAYPYGVFERGRMASSLQSSLRNLETGGACGYVLDFRRVRNNLMPIISGLGPILSTTNAPVFTEVHPNGSSDAVKYEPSTGNSTWRDEIDVTLNKAQPWQPKRPQAPVAILTGPLNASDSLLVAFAGRANTWFLGESRAFQPFDYHYKDFADGSLVGFPAGVVQDRLGHKYDAPLEMNETIATDWAVFATKNDTVLQMAQAWLESQPACK